MVCDHGFRGHSFTRGIVVTYSCKDEQYCKEVWQTGILTSKWIYYKHLAASGLSEIIHLGLSEGKWNLFILGLLELLY